MSLSPPKWLHEKDRKTANIIRNNGLANMLGEALDSLGKSRIFYLVCICLDAVCRKKLHVKEVQEVAVSVAKC